MKNGEKITMLTKNSILFSFLFLIIIGQSILIYDEKGKIKGLEAHNEDLNGKYNQLFNDFMISNSENKKLEEDFNELMVNYTLTNEELATANLNIDEKEVQISEHISSIQNLKYLSKANYSIIGVDYLNKGEIIPLEVYLKEGKGALYVDINNVIYDYSLQESIDNAIIAAKEISNESLDESDIFIKITAPLSASKPVIGGGSGGAAITLTVIACIQEQNLNGSILITGTADTKNTIGPVGGIIPKAKAARDYGASKIIVPLGQKEEVDGIDIIEVLTIEEAYKIVKEE